MGCMRINKRASSPWAIIQSLPAHTQHAPPPGLVYGDDEWDGHERRSIVRGACIPITPHHNHTAASHRARRFLRRSKPLAAFGVLLPRPQSVPFLMRHPFPMGIYAAPDGALCSIDRSINRLADWLIHVSVYPHTPTHETGANEEQHTATRAAAYPIHTPRQHQSTQRADVWLRSQGPGWQRQQQQQRWWGWRWGEGEAPTERGGRFAAGIWTNVYVCVSCVVRVVLLGETRHPSQPPHE